MATGSPAYDRGAFRQIGERARYSGERLNVVVGTFVGPDGFTFEREIVRTFGAVCVVPLESDREHVLLVRQYRGPVDQALLELPAGKLDVAGEAPEHCAARELNEEVGMKAERFTELGHFYNSPGFCDELTVCFLAEELRAESAPRTGSRRNISSSNGSPFLRSTSSSPQVTSPTPRRSPACS